MMCLEQLVRQIIVVVKYVWIPVIQEEVFLHSDSATGMWTWYKSIPELNFSH